MKNPELMCSSSSQGSIDREGKCQAGVIQLTEERLPDEPIICLSCFRALSINQLQTNVQNTIVICFSRSEPSKSSQAAWRVGAGQHIARHHRRLCRLHQAACGCRLASCICCLPAPTHSSNMPGGSVGALLGCRLTPPVSLCL